MLRLTDRGSVTSCQGYCRARPFAVLRVTFADLTAVPEELVSMLISNCLADLQVAGAILPSCFFQLRFCCQVSFCAR